MFLGDGTVVNRAGQRIQFIDDERALYTVQQDLGARRACVYYLDLLPLLAISFFDCKINSCTYYALLHRPLPRRHPRPDRHVPIDLPAQIVPRVEHRIHTARLEERNEED